MAEIDLAVLLRTMEPVLHPEPYGYGVWTGGILLITPFATVTEQEGMTVVAPLAEMREAGFQSDPWARISLTVQSDLAAVGLTAALAGALGREGISCNVIAGYHHDHLFVQWDRREDALAALRRLAVA
ncbi:ACT domain-containing protein [Tabrizicola sp.]|uniref:ACT domain-containing protein n=1 Tax=Tabrizicola sp. TaxID=2005166 RepID=UPI002735CB56|nr:ACT domain-containing protein [Tabrizicola sp.]MDP3193695.1 ACT domain-containing protein [Tabrizicola sp.]MDZ4068224.1 ACT domain-containing protein [Tabrizicola sp.]